MASKSRSLSKPSLVVNDPPNCAVGYTKLTSQAGLCDSFAVLHSHVDNLLLCKPSSWMICTFAIAYLMIELMSALAHHVIGIILASTLEQMLGIDALCYITGVQDKLASISIVRQEERDTVNLVLSALLVAKIEVWVSRLDLATRPKPALVRASYIDVTPEQLNLGWANVRDWLNMKIGHVVLLIRSMCQVVGVGFSRSNACPIIA